MKLFRHGKLSVRLLQRDDSLMLAKWLSDSRVLKYYEGRDRPHDLQTIEKVFFEKRDDITQCIIEYEEQAIGYIQYYEITDSERQAYGYMEFQGTIYGMDQFIGEVEYWNQGWGTKLITSMIYYLETSENADKIVMDPQAWNKRALHVYNKCGFVRKKYIPKHEWHEGQYRDCWIIEYEKKIR